MRSPALQHPPDPALADQGSGRAKGEHDKGGNHQAPAVSPTPRTKKEEEEEEKEADAGTGPRTSTTTSAWLSPATTSGPSSRKSKIATMRMRRSLRRVLSVSVTAEILPSGCGVVPGCRKARKGAARTCARVD